MELRTVMGAPLYIYTRNASRQAHVPQSLRRSMSFQHDGAPSHYTNDVHQNLNVIFVKHWICRGDSVQWPARSPETIMPRHWCTSRPLIQLKMSSLAS
ncbi:hypothetical protein AVEN_227503-1 [Araneus ventricosus]|uniref:Tc1-like transposase DDE domain-containing protein n=1 Tax=Araneus ventricosus TaxID=182803 RepID=A0A4Y2C3E3_ARAVE|nr:hypothetical protein AVEN_227503-1 [Araneus ventricosus]